MAKILSVFVLALTLLAATMARAQETVYNRILVKINDSIITQFDLDQEMAPILAKVKGRTLSDQEKQQLKQLRAKVLQDMVNDILIQQEVKKFQITVSDEDIDKEIAQVRKERKLSPEQFTQVVAKDGLTMKAFRNKLKKLIEKQQVIGHMVNQKVLVTDTDIKNYYDSHKADYQQDKMIELGILLLPSDMSAADVKKQITDGKMTFAEAVAKYSVGPGADNGGSIGELSYQDLSQEWKDALKGVPQGGVAGPLTIQEHPALLSPIHLNDDQLVPLDQVKDAIYQKLTQQMREKLFNEYFDKLKQSSVIVYMDPSLNPANGVSK